jgi:hypothetical protein
VLPPHRPQGGRLAEGISFPIKVKRVVTWTYGNRSYLVFRQRDAGGPMGIVLHHSGAGGPHVATMCHWCQRVRVRGEVRLLSARVTRRRSVGQYLCADLSCFHDQSAAVYESPAEVIHRIDRAFERMYELFSARLMPC